MPDFKSFLTLDDLKEIQERNRGNPDVMKLLWEIKRSHAIVSRAYQLARSISDHAGGAGIISKALKSEVAGHPVVIARDEMNKAIFGQKVEPGDND